MLPSWQITPAVLSREHENVPIRSLVHSSTLASYPLHPILEYTIGTSPSPKNELVYTVGSDDLTLEVQHTN